MGLGGDIAPRLLLAPLAVLSPGPRLAGTPSTGEGKRQVETVVTVSQTRRLPAFRWHEHAGCRAYTAAHCSLLQSIAVFGHASGAPTSDPATSVAPLSRAVSRATARTRRGTGPGSIGREFRRSFSVSKSCYIHYAQLRAVPNPFFRPKSADLSPGSRVTDCKDYKKLTLRLAVFSQQAPWVRRNPTVVQS
jgi:hypothetical protein